METLFNAVVEDFDSTPREYTLVTFLNSSKLAMVAPFWACKELREISAEIRRSRSLCGSPQRSGVRWQGHPAPNQWANASRRSLYAFLRTMHRFSEGDDLFRI